VGYEPKRYKGGPRRRRKIEEKGGGAFPSFGILTAGGSRPWWFQSIKKGALERIRGAISQERRGGSQPGEKGGLNSLKSLSERGIGEGAFLYFDLRKQLGRGSGPRKPLFEKGRRPTAKRKRSVTTLFGEMGQLWSQGRKAAVQVLPHSPRTRKHDLQKKPAEREAPSPFSSGEGTMLTHSKTLSLTKYIEKEGAFLLGKAKKLF